MTKKLSIRDRLLNELNAIPDVYLRDADIIGIDPSWKCTAICCIGNGIVSGPGTVILGGSAPFESEHVIAFVERSRFSGPNFTTTRSAAMEAKKSIKRWYPHAGKVIFVDPDIWHKDVLGFCQPREAVKAASVSLAIARGYSILTDDEADAANIAEWGLERIKLQRLLRGIERKA